MSSRSVSIHARVRATDGAVRRARGGGVRLSAVERYLIVFGIDPNEHRAGFYHLVVIHVHFDDRSAHRALIGSMCPSTWASSVLSRAE